MSKKRRVINGKFVSLVAAVLLLLLSVIKVPAFVKETKLEKFGYSKEAVAVIKKQSKLKNEILKNSYYSDYLNEEIVKEDFNSKYLHLYVNCEYLDDNYFFIYEKLQNKKGYSKEELTKLFGELNYYELRALIVLDKVDVEEFISDSKANNNGADKMIFNNNYLSEETVLADNPEDIEVYVSENHLLGDYKPEKLAPISTQNGIPNLQLETRALEAFDRLCSDMRKNSNGIYAVRAYLEDAGDSSTGLSVCVVSSENESLAGFKDTNAYSYLKDHAHLFGFIFRYPENKEGITGNKAMPYYLRYVGEELASKIYSYKMTFDEYYYLYMD